MISPRWINPMFIGDNFPELRREENSRLLQHRVHGATFFSLKISNKNKRKNILKNTNLGPNLVSTLACLQMDDFPHFTKNTRLKKETTNRLDRNLLHKWTRQSLEIRHKGDRVVD